MYYVGFIEEWRFSTRPLVRPDCFCWISARTVPCMPGAFPEEADDAVFPPRETVGWRLFDAKSDGRAGSIVDMLLWTGALLSTRADQVAVGSAKAIIRSHHNGLKPSHFHGRNDRPYVELRRGQDSDEVLFVFYRVATHTGHCHPPPARIVCAQTALTST
jgi:hypothetical protein